MECEFHAVPIAASPPMVSRLKGSMRLRPARCAFWSGVSGLTAGPFTKRAYQSITGTWGTHSIMPTILGGAESALSSFSTTELARTAAVAAIVAAALRSSHGPAGPGFAREAGCGSEGRSCAEAGCDGAPAWPAAEDG